ncbi:MAG: TIGR03086 family protein [Actinobacteria bacterium 13_2_20CM_2_71_6]|nr:MAG: TIGR03086 family protein [Actinobacteria bacterium 13_2_20CM_2_71_6]
MDPASFSTPTPCPEFDVRTLANHLIWSLHIAVYAARKQPVPAELTEQRDYTAEGWPDVFTRTVDEQVRAWADPAAWEGTTTFGGAELPAAFAGDLSWSDLIVHSWDLAVATGQRLDVPEDLASAAYEILAGIAKMGRDMGFYGPEVAVPEDAPALDRVLAVTGRDPAWRPA